VIFGFEQNYATKRSIINDVNIDQMGYFRPLKFTQCHTIITTKNLKAS